MQCRSGGRELLLQRRGIQYFHLAGAYGDQAARTELLEDADHGLGGQAEVVGDLFTGHGKPVGERRQTMCLEASAEVEQKGGDALFCRGQAGDEALLLELAGVERGSLEAG